MSVEAAIVERWGSYKPLTDLVPAEKIWTGPLPPGDEPDSVKHPFPMPYVSIEPPADLEVTRTSKSILTSGVYQLRIHAVSLSGCRAIAGEVDKRFGNKDFSYSGGTVQDFRLVSRPSVIEDETKPYTWMVTGTYRVRTTESR